MTFVNVETANLYQEPRFKSAIDSQLLLWEKLIVLEEETQFTKVKGPDGYEGWVNKKQLVTNAPSFKTYKMVHALHSPIYNSPNLLSTQVRAVAAGSVLPILEQVNEWSQTVMPDGQKGWLPNRCFKPFAGSKKEVILGYAKQFLGAPYFWGGKSVHGIDCSGFTQIVHSLAGISIRRDSPMQFEDGTHVSDDITGGTPGDLLFFAENGTRITHVGILLEKNVMIHARGLIRLNSLTPEGIDFDASLAETFVGIKTFI